MALLLQLRARIKSKTFTNPSLLHMFSTSNSGDDKPEPSGDSATSDHQSAADFKSPFSSYFSDVKDSLKQRQPTASQPRKSPAFSVASSGGTSPPASTLEDIRKNLSEFRRRTSAPSPGEPSSPQISFQELYKRNVLDKSGESTGNASLGLGNAAGGNRSFDALRQSIGKLQSSGGSVGDRKGVDRMSLSAFRDSLKLKPSDSAGSATSSRVIGGTGALPASIFGREMREKKEGESSARMKSGLMRPYTYEKLGEKLRELRPEVKGKEWFSMGELSERLVKLMEIDERDAESAFRLVSYKDLKDTLNLLNDDAKKTPLQRLDILGQWGKTPAYMLKPPKEHLVEKYFHPDNMSSAEKLKIELTKVRDEFKMSESDCGSARVQVAQLTTKIKHLSSVLHKKDVHSRKGLLAMVQRRKRLLKYLRRTDWDSYCFVIYKLGLRDNPDNVSGRARPSKSTKKIPKKRKLSSPQKA